MTGDDILKYFSGLDLKAVASFMKRYRKEAVIGGVLVLFTILFLQFVYFKGVREAREIDRRINAVKSDMARLKSELVTAEGLKKDFSGRSERLRLLEAKARAVRERLPFDRQTSIIISELSGLEGSDGIRITAIKPLPPEDKGELLRLPFQISLEGRYKSIGGYIERLENLKRLMVIDNFIIEAKSEDSALLSGQIYLSAFVLKERK